MFFYIDQRTFQNLYYEYIIYIIYIYSISFLNLELIWECSEHLCISLSGLFSLAIDTQNNPKLSQLTQLSQNGVLGNFRRKMERWNYWSDLSLNDCCIM